jgi:hypothetical protein
MPDFPELLKGLKTPSLGLIAVLFYFGADLLKHSEELGAITDIVGSMVIAGAFLFTTLTFADIDIKNIRIASLSNKSKRLII